MDWGQILTNTVSAGLGVEAVVFTLAAIGLNIHFGYTGLLNFGQAGFLAVAAYGLATMVATFSSSFWLGIVVGLLGSVVLALLLGVPTLRLRADYLAIVTIAAAEIIRLLVRSVTFREYFGGSDGLTNFANDFFALNPFTQDRYDIGPFSYSRNDLFVILVGWVLVAVCLLITYLLMRSPWGRVIKGIREDEDAVRSLGKNVFSYKMQALILGGVLGCLGGFIIAIARQAVNPDTFATDLTFFAWTVLILGGAARVFGPVLGAIIFWALLAFTDNALNQAINSGTITFMESTQVGQVRFMLVGLALVVLMVYRPQGILGDKREIQLDAR
jgi:branched-chain amino acid transport system permease protein